MRKLDNNIKLILFAYLPIVIFTAVLGGSITKIFTDEFAIGLINGCISITVGVIISFYLPESQKSLINKYLWKFIGQPVELLFIPHDKVVVKILRDTGITTIMVPTEEWNKVSEWYRLSESKEYIIDVEFINGVPTRTIRLNKDSILEFKAFQITSFETIVRNIRGVLTTPTIKVAKVIYLLTAIWVAGISYLIFNGGLTALTQFNDYSSLTFKIFKVMYGISNLLLRGMIAVYILEALRATLAALKGNRMYLLYSEKLTFTSASLLPNMLIALILVGNSVELASGVKFICQKLAS